MSRKIVQLHDFHEENLQNRTPEGKVIITEYQQNICSFLINDNRLLNVHTLDSSSKIGNIYIAKVKNVLKNINACFVEIAEKEICFLPLNEAQNPFILNRIYDGRIVQGDELLVQFTKDALKTKQAGVTCNVSLPDDSFVFAIGNPKLGISSKLSPADKSHIRQLLCERGFIDSNGQITRLPTHPEYGLIIRTDALHLLEESEETFIKEFQLKQEAFLHFLETSRHKQCFDCIITRKMPYKAILDNYSNTDYQEVVTDLNEAYTGLQGISKPVRLYTDESYSLNKLYSLETKLQDALKKTVWMKSGANLVIEQTECLNTIDVNSGKKITAKASPDTIWQINMEAAAEAALQIRLRNLSGIIIIDFINMEDKSLEEKLLQHMKALVAKDPIITNVIDITPLGLMEITRKKVSKSLSEQFQRSYT